MQTPGNPSPRQENKRLVPCLHIAELTSFDVITVARLKLSAFIGYTHFWVRTLLLERRARLAIRRGDLTTRVFNSDSVFFVQYS